MAQGYKTEVEHCHILSCSWLIQTGYFDWPINAWLKLGGITWNNIFGDPLYTLSFEIRPTSEITMLMVLVNTCQRVSLTASPLPFGGFRWWFCCPICSSRVAKLYLPRAGYFACRRCHNLTYRSCNQSGHKIMGCTTSQLAAGIKEKNWFRYLPWRRRRDRRPDYRDRGAWLREIIATGF